MRSKSAKLAMDSEIGGVNTSVTQIQSQLNNDIWELSQTTIRAPADGYVTIIALIVGDRAFQLRSAMSFIVENEITIVGMFSQNGFQAIMVGTPVDGVFDNARAAFITQRLPQFPTVSVRSTLPYPGHLHAPMRSAAHRCGLGCPETHQRSSTMLALSVSSGLFSSGSAYL
jgi:hypothetical protein